MMILFQKRLLLSFFSDEHGNDDYEKNDFRQTEVSEKFFEQDINDEEEDFEIPAFLRRQKF